MKQRRAKIAVTLGPASDPRGTLARMVRAGVDVARINFSHGTAEDHGRRVAELRRAARVVGRPVALLADLQGPRFRIGRLPGGRVALEPDRPVRLLAGQETSRDPEALPVTYRALAGDVKRGARVLIDDGNVELRVVRVRDRTVHCVVVRGGEVSDHKGINLPGVALSAPALTAKDRRDLRHAVALGTDWLAVSFVRRAEDVRQVKRLLQRAGRPVPVMAKIERPEAIDRLEAILDASDGVLVARGDLGVELSPQAVPLLQKQIVDAANAAGKPVFTATQMLESMRHSRRPTRAEAADVANAVIDGSDGLLLTAETAVGRFPVETVEMMARIIEGTERSGRVATHGSECGRLAVAEATCLAGCRAAREVGARCLAVFTRSGFSALQTARFRPETPILAFAVGDDVVRRLAPVWGVAPRKAPTYRTVEQMMRALDRALLREGLASPGDRVVLLAGTPVGVPGTTNLMEIHEVGGPIRGGRRRGTGASA